jgi:hypothetical protein
MSERLRRFNLYNLRGSLRSSHCVVLKHPSDYFHDEAESEKQFAFRGGNNSRNAGVHVAHYDFLSAGTASWRRRRARMRRMRIRNPRATCAVTLLAWLIALCVCTTALIFLSRDFVQSRKSVVLSTRLERQSTIQLPVMYICSSFVNTPVFPLFHAQSTPVTRRHGASLFGMRAVYRKQGKSGLLRADAGLIATPAFRGTDSQSCIKHFSIMNVSSLKRRPSELSSDAESASSDCQFCYRLGSNSSPLRVTDEQDTADVTKSTAGFRIHLDSLSALLSCQNYPQDNIMNVASHSFLIEQIHKSRYDLAKRNIIDWGGLDLSNRTAFDLNITAQFPQNDSEHPLLFPSQSYEVACHTYFFSGFWYVSLPLV